MRHRISPPFRTYLVTELLRLIPAEVTTYNEMNPLAQRDVMTSRPTIEEMNRIVPDVMAACQRHMPEHPVLMHYAKTRDISTALRISDLIGQRELHRRGLYADLYRPLRIEYTLCNALSTSHDLVIGMAVHRRMRDFSGHERFTFDVIRSHLLQAYQNAAALRGFGSG